MTSSQRLSLPVVLLLLLPWATVTAGGAPAAKPMPAPAVLLAKLHEAARELSYDGVIVYQRGGELSTLRIVHRGAPGAEAERIITLDGPAREVVRDAEQVSCAFSDQDHLSQRRPGLGGHPLLFGGPDSEATLERYYQLRTAGRLRLAGRDAWRVVIEPRQPNRYGYELAVDAEHHLLLKAAVLDADGNQLEQTRFTSIEFPDAIDDADLAPRVVVLTMPARRPARVPAVDEPAGFTVPWLPEGFALSGEARERLGRGGPPVSHKVFTDGLAMVSVFLEASEQPDGEAMSYASMGAVNTFSRVESGYKVTVVGELPAATVRRIAEAVAPGDR